MKNNKGFSFVELLVAVAILGIISLPIASSFALAAKTDAKAVQLSAMNDAADDVMLLLKEIETLDDIPEGETEFDSKAEYYISEVFKPFLGSENLEAEPPEESVDVYKIQYNGYHATLTISEVVADKCYRIDLIFTHSVAGSPLEVHRKGLLKYA